MIAGLGLRLALAGGREALMRMAFIVIGVWVGLTLLLLCPERRRGGPGARRAVRLDGRRLRLQPRRRIAASRCRWTRPTARCSSP